MLLDGPPGPIAPALTAEQEAIVDFDEGPVVVIAGAGTGKTRVIVERVRRLLETRGAGGAIPEEPVEHGDPFGGPLVPEQVLVLTYNVKAARELTERFEQSLGPTIAARLRVSNFHSFCARILSESADDAGLPARPDVLDGIGQVLLLRDLRPRLDLVYHAGGGSPNLWLDAFVGFINRAKDELVGPDRFDLFVAAERAAFEERFGDFDEAVVRIRGRGDLRPIREVRRAYARERVWERSVADGRRSSAEPMGAESVDGTADREARRSAVGTGVAVGWRDLTLEQAAEAEALRSSYVVDGAALEVLRWAELGAVYRAYETELANRGAVDFGEQIRAVIDLFRRRPNVLRQYQRQFRYLLVDEFQDANIAQIELLEMLARSPDRPANVMVVGDDDQSIYRFRGASFAAFAEFDRRFSRPPADAPDGPGPDPPRRLRLEANFRSDADIIATAARLIARNERRFLPDKALRPTRPQGSPVEVVRCLDPGDEAELVVERVRALVDGGALPGEIAVLYRKHRHRDAIVERLDREGIPYTVVGGLSAFALPEIRDLEQSLRAIANPHDDVAVARMLSAGPWRLDALEILAVARMASYDRRHLIEAIADVIDTGELVRDALPGSLDDPGPLDDPGALGHPATLATLTLEPDAANGPTIGGVTLQPPVADPFASVPGERTPIATRRVAIAPETRARLRRFRETLEALGPLTWREGPLAVLVTLIERTSLVHDLIAADSRAAKRSVVAIASFLRFANDWQAAHPNGHLAGFLDYLDAYLEAAGDLPTSVDPVEDLAGVKLMTVYQAKGLEYDHVIVPQLVDGEWPVRERSSGLFPTELLRERVDPVGLHEEEERRLLYVAMTRARSTLLLSTNSGRTGDARPSRFLGEIVGEHGPELVVVDRGVPDVQVAGGDELAAAVGSGPGPEAGAEAAAARRVMPIPTDQERRFALRRRAVELLGSLESVDPADPEAAAARTRLLDELLAVGREASRDGDAARVEGRHPVSLRVVAADSAVGADLLEVAPLPTRVSYSQLDVYEKCPLQYAFRHVYRIPVETTRAALTFGSTAHAAFEAFTRERRERIARGESPPDREYLRQRFAEAWKGGVFPNAIAEANYRGRVTALIDRFWRDELSGVGEALHEELEFELVLEPADGGEPVRLTGSIDRIDRLPTGGLEVIDYKTGRLSSQKDVEDSLQLSIYALACRDALRLGTPERVSLYFTEAGIRQTTSRTDEQLDAARDEILARVARMRRGDFAATPDPGICRRCDFASLCPSRAV